MIDWNGDFESLGMNMFPLELLAMLADAVNERLIAVHYPSGGSADSVDVPSAGANSCSQPWWRELQDKVESMESDFLESTHPDNDDNPDYPPFRRKRPRQIYQTFTGIVLEGGGTPTAGMRARSIKNPSNSTPGTGKVYEFDGSDWVLTDNPVGDMPDTLELEGKIEVGDYIGGHLAADLRDKLNLMSITQESTSRYGHFREHTTDEVFGSADDAFDWAMLNPSIYVDINTAHGHTNLNVFSYLRFPGPSGTPEAANRDPDIFVGFYRLTGPGAFPIAGTAVLAIRTAAMVGPPWHTFDDNGYPVVEGDWCLTEYPVSASGTFDETFVADGYEPVRTTDPVTGPVSESWRGFEVTGLEMRVRWSFTLGPP